MNFKVRPSLHFVLLGFSRGEQCTGCNVIFETYRNIYKHICVFLHIFTSCVMCSGEWNTWEQLSLNRALIPCKSNNNIFLKVHVKIKLRQKYIQILFRFKRFPPETWLGFLWDEKKRENAWFFHFCKNTRSLELLMSVVSAGEWKGPVLIFKHMFKTLM